jgi:membrane associated rhomboid family serine protease
MYRTSFGPFGHFLTPWVKRLIVANAVLFLLTWTGVIDLGWAAAYLGFTASEILTKPWGLVTYMFIHGGFFHVFVNMLALFFFGPPLEDRWGGTEFIKFYTICGVGGALFTFVFGGGTIIGASGAVFGVMLAYALNWPDNLIWIWGIFPIKAKYFVMFLGALSFFSAFAGSSDGIAHFAHLGGLIVGYVYLKKGWAMSAQFDSLKRSLRRRKLTVVPGSAGEGTEPEGSSPVDDEARVLDEVDRILDKIAAQGLGSLTPEERSFLDEISRRRKTRE